VQGAVAASDAEVLQVDRAGFGDPQAEKSEESEQGDHGGVHGPGPSCHRDQGPQLHSVQAQGLGLG